MNYEQLVLEFHKIYGLTIGETPQLPEEEVRDMRRALIFEEVIEYIEAEDNDDIVEIADALADLVYVCIGACISYGIPFDAVFKEVQRSNMSKLGKDGKPMYREDGKVLKGPDFTEPDIRGILE
jgi:predicted HAD superfamily Cof-like phosphohydrolase